jgi:hypothetical protein
LLQKSLAWLVQLYILLPLTYDHIKARKMFRSKPPIPQPARPSEATNEINYLSAHVQQLLAVILPQPVVTILAAISDALYRAVLGQPNDPPTYTSTLAPPAILIGVTYLAILLVYKSVRSFIGMLIFSLKWAVILGVIGVLVAYHYGNGDVQQGAQSLAQQTGLSSSSWSNMLRNCESFLT